MTLTKLLLSFAVFAVLESLAVSQILYVLSPLASQRGVMNEVNSLLYNFLWGGIRTPHVIPKSRKGAKRFLLLQLMISHW